MTVKIFLTPTWELLLQSLTVGAVKDLPFKTFSSPSLWELTLLPPLRFVMEGKPHPSWTRCSEEILVESIRSHKCLWDHKDESSSQPDCLDSSCRLLKGRVTDCSTARCETSVAEYDVYTMRDTPQPTL
ncbi:hypothetical protein O3P69_014571 [Scylla paramamosain]|uniref:Uncharacterized protein n=1 Tax=Scylla paramamosain TaxID=85552 RepID=A0AAW0SDG4_SCYPA